MLKNIYCFLCLFFRTLVHRRFCNNGYFGGQGKASATVLHTCVPIRLCRDVNREHNAEMEINHLQPLDVF